MSGVICDRRISSLSEREGVQGGSETSNVVRVGDSGTDEKTGGGDVVAELKMLRFSLGVTRMDKIRNEYIRGTAQVGKFGDKTREARPIWYGHLRRKDDGYIGKMMLRMELPGKRKRGRPKRKFVDVVK